MFHSAPYDSTGVSYYSVPSLQFAAGPNLPIRVAFRSFNPGSSKVVCVPTSEHGHINTTLNFTTGALKNYHVVVVAMLGNGESSSPSNTDNFPQPLYQDCINAYYELFTKHLKIHELEAVIGYGMGGQQAYYLTCMRPGFAKNAVVICGSAQTSPFNYVLLDGIASALINSASFTRQRGGQQGTDHNGVHHAYGQLICPWSTSSAWFRDEVFRTILGFETLHDYIEKYQSSFNYWDAADLLSLVKMWLLGDVGALREDKDYAKALEHIEARVLVIASSTDYYFSPQESVVEMNHLKRGELSVLETVWGHAAGSGASKEDTELIDRMIADFLTRRE